VGIARFAWGVVRRFIKENVERRVPAIVALHNFRLTIGEVPGARFLDEYARLWRFREVGEYLQRLAPSDRPGPEGMVETEMKVPFKYRYRIRVRYLDTETKEEGETYIAEYSNVLYTKEGVEGIGRAKYEAGEYPERWEVIGVELAAVEHNMGMPY